VPRETNEALTVCDGKNRIIRTITKYSNGDSADRDRQGNVVGKSSQTFSNSRESLDRLASATNADAKVLFRR
jgi:hypothetical protein